MIRFMGLFQRLVTICGDAIDGNTREECLLLEQLVAIDVARDKPLSLNCSVFIGTVFKESDIYVAFIQSKVRRTIDLAHKATSDVERMELLEPIRDMAGMPGHLLDTIEMAIALTNVGGGFADEDMAAYIFNHRPQAAPMAVYWYPDTVVGTLGHLAGSIDDGLGLIAYPVFARPRPPSSRPAFSASCTTPWRRRR